MTAFPIHPGRFGADDRAALDAVHMQRGAEGLTECGRDPAALTVTTDLDAVTCPECRQSIGDSLSIEADDLDPDAVPDDWYDVRPFPRGPGTAARAYRAARSLAAWARPEFGRP